MHDPLRQTRPKPFRHGPGPGPALADDGDACRGCGCTASNACVTERGPCGWAEDGLCTACVDVVARTLGAPALRYLLLTGCHAIAPGASTTRPGADALTAEGVLDLRQTLTRILRTLEPPCPPQEGHAHA